MAFKLNPPYRINPVSVHEVAFTPDNEKLGDGPEKALVAKANDNGTIIINKDIPRNSELYNNAISHEGQHLKDMMDNKLSYDENFVYENMDGKGAKKHGRESFSESDKNLPWEKVAYAAGDNKVQHDLRPKPEKLSGPPSMKDETPLAFKVMGSRHNEQRSPDKEKISMNEQFGMYAPAKKWGGPSAVSGEKDPPVSGLNKQSDAGGNDSSPEFSPKKNDEYTGPNISYNPSNNKFTYTQGEGGSRSINSLDDLYSGNPGDFDYQKNLKLDEDSGIDARTGDGGARSNYNREFNSMMKNTTAARSNFAANNNYFKDDRANASLPTSRQDSGKGDGSTVQYKLTPDFAWDDTQNNRDNMNRMEYVQSFFDKDGKPSDKYAGGKLKFGRSAGDAGDQKYLDGGFKGQLSNSNTRYLADNFSSNEALQKFAKNHPNTFKISENYDF